MSRYSLSFTLIVALMIFGMTEVHARPQNDLLNPDRIVFEGPTNMSSEPSDGRNFPSIPDQTTRSSTTQSAEIARCIRDCPTTPEYNPVCGTDNVVYSNPGKLSCAISCGQNTGLRYTGPCSTNLRG